MLMLIDRINIYISYIFCSLLFSSSNQKLILMNKYKLICINADTSITYTVQWK